MASKTKSPLKISVTEVAARLRTGVFQGDTLRSEGLTGLVSVKRVKVIQARRERARLEVRYGKSDPRLAELDRRLFVEHQQLVQARQERDRTKAIVPARDAKKWVVYGYARDVDGHALEDYRVTLYPDANAKGKRLGSTSTDATGFYQIELTSGLAEALKREQTPAAAAGIATATARYLVVQDSTGKLVHRESNPVYPVAGGLTYRDLRVPSVTRTDAANLPSPYLGNTRSHELHDLKKLKPSCQVSEILPVNRAYFDSVEQAGKAGYDRCAYCFGKGASKR